MRWSSPAPWFLGVPTFRRLSQGRSVPALLAFMATIIMASALLLYSSPDEKRISIYSNAANYTLPVLDRNGADYVGLLEVFEPLGSVNAKATGPRWKFRYYNVESEFTTGKTRARIRGGADLARSLGSGFWDRISTG